MAYRCDLCGKRIVVSTQQRHKKGVAGERWKYRAPKTKKISKPNLQTFRGILNGKKGKWRLCIKCLRIIKGEQKEKPAPSETPAPKSA